MNNATQGRIAVIVNRAFGNRLKEARRARTVTQAKLAEMLGLSRVTIANLERGSQNVQLHQVFAIAKALNVVPENLIPSTAQIEGMASERRGVRSDHLTNSDLVFLNLAHDQLLLRKGSNDEIAKRN